MPRSPYERSPDVSRAVAALRTPGAPDAVGGEINLLFRDGTEPTTGPELYELSEGFDQEQFVTGAHFAATANLVVPARVFDEVGPFDAALRSGGDLQWGRRLQQAGRTLGFAGDAVVDHPSRPGWRELTRKTIRIANGHVDLASDPETASFVADSWHNARHTVTIWHWIWKTPWPSTRTAKLRFAAARSYAGLLELGVRGYRKLRERRP